MNKIAGSLLGCTLLLALCVTGAGLEGAYGQAKAPAIAPRDTKIMGGVEAKPGEWPWQVAIYFRRPNGAFLPGCGGSVIHERWVLTAAHCVASRDAPDILLVEGTQQIGFPLRTGDGAGRQIEVKRIVVHDRFNRVNLENDIALLELSTPARSLPVPIVSASQLALEAAGRDGVVTGWGLLRPVSVVDGRPVDALSSEPVQAADPRYFTDRLMQLEIPLVDQETCRRAYSDLLARGMVIDERVLCAGVVEGGKDACKGDSGGPLVTRDQSGRYVQIGVISWGRNCGMPDGYGINTRISAFAGWIETQTGAIGPRPEPPPAPAVAPVAQVPGLPVVAVGDRALLVGIDRYMVERFNLRGTVNDVRNMRKFLIEVYGFKPEQIVTLTDEQATRANILSAIDRWLIGGSAPGSRVFFFMSSHGFQEADKDGDEADSLDETLVPYDAVIEQDGGRTFVRNQIIDDEIRERLTTARDRRITVILDSCFSGTATRAPDVRRDRAPGTVKHLGAVLTADELRGIESARAATRRSVDLAARGRTRSATNVTKPIGFVERLDNVIVWSATDDRQLAFVDTESPEPQGVFTRRFIEGIVEKRADRSGDGIVSFAELLDYVRNESESYCSRHETCRTQGLTPRLEIRRELLVADVVTERLPPSTQAIVVGGLAHGNPAGLSIEIVEGDVLKFGQRAHFRVSTRRAGYLVLIDVTPDGRATQVFPNTRSLTTPTGRRPRANLLEPNRPIVVPDRRNPYEGFAFIVEPPAGEGLLVAIVSEGPIRSIPLPERPRTFEGAAAIADYVSTIAGELSRNLVVEGRPRPRNWSVAVKRYRVMP